MSNKEQRVQTNLRELVSEQCSDQFFADYYGIVPATETDLFDQANQWAAFYRKTPQKLHENRRVDRGLFERFLHVAEVTPRKWAAAQLGMDEASFKATIKDLPRLSPIPLPSVDLPPCVVSESLVKRFQLYLPSTARRLLASSHSSRCRLIHKAIRDDLGIEVTPLICDTSKRLDSTGEPDYAYGFDCLTFRPLGLKNQVWLETKKPMSLRPDATSLLTVAAFPALVEPRVFAGHRPEITDSVKEAAAAWLREA